MKASGGLSPPCMPYLKSRNPTKTKPWIKVDSKRSVFGTGAMVMGVARHPFRSHLVGPLAVEQSCGLLCLRLRVIHRFDRMSWLAIGSSILSSILGVYTSYWSDSSPAGCIVLVQTGLFVIAFLFAPKHGILRHRFASSMPISRLPD